MVPSNKYMNAGFDILYHHAY